MGEQKKEKQSQKGKIINIVIMAIEIVVIVACIVLSAGVIAGVKNPDEGLPMKYNLSTVLTSSMDGDISQFKIKSFDTGALVVIKKLSDEEKGQLEVGDVVSYKSFDLGMAMLVSHRIIGKTYSETMGQWLYVTKGDNEEDFTPYEYWESDILGEVVFVIPKIGNVLKWFQDATNFLWSVVIPLAGLLIYNVAIFIKQVMAAKIKKVEEKNKADLENLKESLKKEMLGSVDSDNKSLNEEEIKRKAIEEYLASIKNDAEKQNKDIISEEIKKE